MHDNEGFIHNGRKVFALRYRLESEPPTIVELIVPLGRDGNSTGSVRPAEPGKRMVTVKPGEYLLHEGKPKKVLAVEVYRSLPLVAPRIG